MNKKELKKMREVEQVLNLGEILTGATQTSLKSKATVYLGKIGDDVLLFKNCDESTGVYFQVNCWREKIENNRKETKSLTETVESLQKKLDVSNADISWLKGKCAGIVEGIQVRDNPDIWARTSAIVPKDPTGTIQLGQKSCVLFPPITAEEISCAINNNRSYHGGTAVGDVVIAECCFVCSTENGCPEIGVAFRDEEGEVSSCFTSETEQDNKIAELEKRLEKLESKDA